MQTIHDLQAELAAAGLGKPAVAKMFAKLSVHVVAATSLFAAAVLVEPIWAKALLIVAGAWLNVGAIMCGHDGVHQAVSARRWLNDAIGWFSFTLLGGLACDYWRVKHNLKHHPFCNVADRDPDVDQWPFAFSRPQHDRSPWHIRAFHRIQAWAFYPIVVVFMAPLMRWAGLVHSVKNAWSRPKAAVDIVVLALHLALWLGVPRLLGVSWPMTLALYAATTSLGGVYLTMIFAPAHMTTPLVKEYRDPLLLQLATTRNFNTNALLRFSLIGLDQQIEHHLVPRLSSFDLPKARPIVKAFCARNGLPYTETTWLRGLIETQVRLDIGWDLPEIILGDRVAPVSKEPAEAAV
jgi:fatty acid desaturase